MQKEDASPNICQFQTLSILSGECKNRFLSAGKSDDCIHDWKRISPKSGDHRLCRIPKTSSGPDSVDSWSSVEERQPDISLDGPGQCLGINPRWSNKYRVEVWPRSRPHHTIISTWLGCIKISTLSFYTFDLKNPKINPPLAHGDE